MKNVMVRAWEIAREAVVKFGGKVKEYFAEALKMAWGEFRKGVKAMDKRGQFIAKVREFIALATEAKKYRNSVNVVDADAAINMFKEERADELLTIMATQVQQAKAQLEQLKNTIARTNRFDKVYRLSHLTVDRKSGKYVNKDGEGYHVMAEGLYEVEENGEVKYIQTTRTAAIREIDKATVISWM